MAVIVQKFGGTSVGTIERIKQVSKLIKAEVDMGNKVVVVASAMAGVTDHLVNLSTSVSNLETEQQRMEYDAIVSTGEKVSCGVLALYLQSQGMKARSWQGWQLPIITDECFTNGKIRSIDAERLHSSFANDEISIVTGFQGINNGRIVTLGRGGSDTSAAALAAALRADRCDIYTDVDGVYTADPRIVSDAQKLPYVTFDEMLELAAAGSKVIHVRAVEIAAKFNLKLRVLSSFTNKQGTDIGNREDSDMEGHKITGIAIDKNLSCWEIEAVNGDHKEFIKLYELMDRNAINISQFNILGNKLIMTVPLFEKDRVKKVLEVTDYKFKELPDLAQVSVVGVGVKSDSKILQKIFKLFSVNAINIVVAITSGIRMSFLVPQAKSNSAVACLHEGLLLGKELEE